ncbi:hypothetical protein REPUB_Repub17cG0167100 [Reevesia pubescens]
MLFTEVAKPWVSPVIQEWNSRMRKNGILQAIGDLSTRIKKELSVKERAVTEWDVISHRRDQQQQPTAPSAVPKTWHGH